MRARVAKGMTTVALATMMIILTEGTAHAANSITVDYATGHISWATGTVTYSCDPGSGITLLNVTVTAGGGPGVPSVVTGSITPTCDSAARTVTIGGACVTPSGCSDFIPGRSARVYAGLRGGPSVSQGVFLRSP